MILSAQDRKLSIGAFVKIAVNGSVSSLTSLLLFMGVFIFPIPILAGFGLFWCFMQVRLWISLYQFLSSLVQAGPQGPAPE